MQVAAPLRQTWRLGKEDMVAKKKSAKRVPNASDNGPADVELPDPEADEQEPGAEQQAEQSPKVQKAAEAVEKAKAELEKAQACYQRVRREAVERLQKVRQKTVGDLLDDTLEAVRKHPGPGVIVAAILGFFLGRLFRR